MTVSHLTRTRDQLWSDLLVALGGDEAFLTRSLSERQIILEILDTYDSSISLLTIDDVDALLAAVVNVAGGSASHLRQNKHEILAALVTALGGTAPSSSTSSTGELLAAAVNAAEAGAGDPEWVPADAKIYIDLVNDRAWTEADGEVAIDTLLGADANSVVAWGNTTEYDPANLGANGYTYAGNVKVALINDLKTALLAGATMRFQFRKGATGVDGSFFVGDTSNHALELDFNVGAATNGKLEAYIFSGDFDALSDIDTMNKGEGAINAIAFTFTDARFEYAADGSTVYGGSIVGGGTLPTDITTVALISLRDTDALQSITIYDPLPDTNGLSALSETGV